MSGRKAKTVNSGRGRGRGKRGGARASAVFEFPDSDRVGTTSSSSEYETAVEHQPSAPPTAAPQQAGAAASKAATEFESEQELLGMKIRMLERGMERLAERGRSLKRRRGGNSPDARSSSSSSSSSSESRSRSRSPRQKRKSGAPTELNWKTTSYAKQFALNEELLDIIASMKSKSKRKRRRAAKKGERVLRERQEWLVVAENHGHQVATAFQGGNLLMDLVTGSKKQKRLQAAIQAEGVKKKAAGGVRSLGSVDANVQAGQGMGIPPRPHPGPIQHMPGNFRPPPVCHRCGQPGHFVRVCTQQPTAAGQQNRRPM
eukprot:scpid78546/ scgid10086/ 